jgi:hypothetical protein
MQRGGDMELVIDGNNVRMNAFVQKVVANLTQCILSSLDDVPENTDGIVFKYQAGSDMEIKLGQKSLRMNDFVCRLTENVLKGILASLDDVPADPQSFTLTF